MNVRRIAILATAMAVVVAGATAIAPHPAFAGGPFEPILGDLNGDGLADVVELIVNPPPGGQVGGSQQYRCEVVVRHGAPGGGHLPPEHHPFLTVANPGECPNLGAATNLDDDGPDELVTGWFHGRPPTVDADLVVLDNYQITSTAKGLEQPSFIDTADFNGDGYSDIYQWTDQGEGFLTLYNTRKGSLVPGDIQWCSGRPDYRLTDFHHDGRVDVVIAYAEGCDEYFSGVVALFSDGTVLHLQTSVDGTDTWTIDVLDVNGDSFPDVRTVSEITGQVTTFVNLRDGTFITSPRAIQDKVTVSGTRKTNIHVLANDFVSGDARIRIVEQPRHGTAQVTSSRTVVFTPAAGHGRNDRFVYQVIQDGRTSNASVNLQFATG